MARTWNWSAPVLAITCLALGAAMVLTKRHKDEVIAAAFAAKPARERNLAVFDAATSLIKSNYYNSKYFATPEWQTLEREGRSKAAQVEPTLLYVDVLDSLAQKFPESHVGFSPPPPPKNEDSPPTPGNGANRNAEIADMYERARAGPGFDAPVIRRSHGTPQIVGDLLRGSPAERAGIAPGWILVSSSTEITPDGAHFSAEFMRLDPALSRVNETTGQVQLENIDTQAQLEAFFAEHRVKLEFELEELPAHADFEVRKLPGDVTYVRFDSFEPDGPADRALDAIDDAGAGGLIIDLRHNYGGRQLELMRVTGKLLGSAIVIGHSRSAQRGASPINTLELGGHYQGPLVVLIGPASASAAEIAAAAVQDHQRGKLIGRTTAGAVVVANLFDLPDGGELMVPVSDFVRAGDRRIEGAGVEPDFWVLPTLEDVRAGRDPVLQRALEELRAAGSSPFARK